MLINKENILEIFKNLKVSFNKAFESTETVWHKVAMKVPSTGSENNYKWLSKFPKMRKWVGEKHTKALEAFGYTIVNDDFEVDIEVDRNDVEDGNIGGLVIQATGAGQSAKMLPEEIVEEVVSAGFTKPCYDGQNFYDTDHPVGDSFVSNTGTAVLSATTVAAIEASYGAARTALRSMKDDEGRSLKVRPNVLIVPPALETTAKRIVKAEKINGEDNPFEGTAEVVVMDGLATSTEWHLIDASKAVMPFILQVRKEPVLVEQTDPNSDEVYRKRKFHLGAEARMSGGYSFWQLAYGSTGQG